MNIKLCMCIYLLFSIFVLFNIMYILNELLLLSTSRIWSIITDYSNMNYSAYLRHFFSWTRPPFRLFSKRFADSECEFIYLIIINKTDLISYLIIDLIYSIKVSAAGTEYFADLSNVSIGLHMMRCWRLFFNVTRTLLTGKGIIFEFKPL